MSDASIWPAAACALNVSAVLACAHNKITITKCHAGPRPKNLSLAGSAGRSCMGCTTYCPQQTGHVYIL